MNDLIGIRDLGGRIGGLFPSPDGTLFAVQVRQMRLHSNDYEISWLMVPLDGSEPIVAGDGGELITSMDDDGTNNGDPAEPVAQWSADGNWLAFLRKEAGRVQVWRAFKGGKAPEQVTHADGDVRRFVLEDGRILYTTSTPYKTRAEMDARARLDGFLWDETFWPRYSWFPRSPGREGENVLVANLSDGVQRVATAKEAETFQMRVDPQATRRRPSARLSRVYEDQGLIISAEALDPDRQGERPPLTVVASHLPDGDRQIVCKHPSCSGQITFVALTGAGHVLFIRREGHANSEATLYEWKPTHGSNPRAVFKTHDWIGDDCATAGASLVCLYESVTKPRSIVRIALRNGALKTLFDPNAGFEHHAFSRIEKLEWTDQFGNETYGHLVYPLNYDPDQQYPLVVVQYHSRGWFLRGGTGGEYPIYPLAAAGFFVLSWDRPEFRTLAERLQDLEVVRWAYSERREYKSTLSALETVLDSLQAWNLIDPMRVGISGLSNGAETTYVALIHTGRFAAAIASQPPSDPISYYMLPAKYRGWLGKVTGMPDPAGPGGADEWWNFTSVARNAAHIRAPILMNLSDSELGRAMQTVAALQDQRKPFEAYVYPNEFHIKNQPAHIAKIMERNVDWFNFWLRGVTEADRAKAEQYTRWNLLREGSVDGPPPETTAGP